MRAARLQIRTWADTKVAWQCYFLLRVEVDDLLAPVEMGMSLVSSSLLFSSSTSLLSSLFATGEELIMKPMALMSPNTNVNNDKNVQL